MKKLHDDNHEMVTCGKANKSCRKWNALNIKFPIPKSHPKTQDKSKNTPKPPIHRVPGAMKQLNDMAMESDWLHTMLKFSYHNIKTKDPLTGQPFWNKTTAMTCMRVCALNKSKQLENYNAAKKDEKLPIPIVWMEEDLFKTMNCAPMHMLLLGCTKTTFGMQKSWLENHGATSQFTLQNNVSMEMVGVLHFQAHKLTEASNGTGAHISKITCAWLG